MNDLEKVLEIVDNNLYLKYKKLVDDLETKVYSSINESLAVECGIYTNHDKKHFDLVVRQAGNLLKANEILELVHKKRDISTFDFQEKKLFFFLNSLELFILLCSIRVHDIGLIINRVDHASNIIYTISILNIEISKVIKQTIAKIAGAHTGKSKDGDKDTIRNLEKIESISSQNIRTQTLAAIVRFSDELEEGEHRTNDSKLTCEKVKAENIIFHKYSLSLVDLSINHNEHCLILQFEIEKNENVIYKKPDGTETTLLKEIHNRLQKLEVERKYFHRFMCSSLSIERIHSKINFKDEHGNYERTISVTTMDTYPNVENHGLEDLKKEIEAIQ